MSSQQGQISLEEAKTLPGLFRARFQRSPASTAYRQFDPESGQWRDYSWQQMAEECARWQAAIAAHGLQPGERVGVMMGNCREWVLFDQATLGLGLVNVPLFYNDRGGNVAYIARDCGFRLLLIGGQEQWDSLLPVLDELTGVETIITLKPVAGGSDPRLKPIEEWLPESAPGEFQVSPDLDPHGLASIVYTSGTTGHPKGVMLSHNNILSNTVEALATTTLGENDISLSFLPLSHMLERTGGYYLPMLAGVTVAYARSIPDLPEDLITIRPTLMISVPRIYERIYARVQEGLAAKPAVLRKLFKLAVAVGWRRFQHRQGRGPWTLDQLLWPLLDKLVASKLRERLGGRLRSAISGGAPLPPEVAKTFLALGVPVLQGYGLTETSPVLTVSRLEDNIPESVGTALPGTKLAIGEGGELLAKGAAVMLGFWNNPEATASVIDEEGWFHTGDVARIDDDGHVYITGRIKDIFVLANGEKISPADMEQAITMDPLIEQAVVIGEGKPFLSALLVPEPEQWKQLCAQLQLDPDDEASFSNEQMLEQVCERIGQQLREFPGYAQIRKIRLLSEAWSVENGFLTPTLKTKRAQIMKHCDHLVQEIYAGH